MMGSLKGKQINAYFSKQPVNRKKNLYDNNFKQNDEEDKSTQRMLK